MKLLNNYELITFGILLSPIWILLKDLNLQNDIIFIICLLVLLVLDTGTGIMKGIYHRNFSSRSLRNTPQKVLLYFFLIIACFSISYYIEQYNESIGEWLKAGTFSSILLVELVSITENVAMLSQVYLGRNIVPTFMTKWMKDFDENGIYKNINEQK